jgi:hypothetical protein
MGKKSDLSPECQKFVKKLFAFFSKEKATKKPIVSFDRVYQIVQRRNLKRRLFKEINAPTEHTPGNALK